MLQENQDFLNLFDITNTGFYDPVLLRDMNFGFSIKRKYPANILFKPAVDANGETAQVAVQWVTLRENIKADDGKILLHIRISTFGLIHWTDSEYDDIYDAAENNTPKPLELVYNNDYYFDTHSHIITDKRGQIVTGIQVLNTVFENHCDTSRTMSWANLELKLKRLQRDSVDKVFLAAIFIVKNLIELVFRRHINGEVYNIDYSTDLEETLQTLPPPEGDEVTFYKWKTHKATIVLFSLIVVLTTFGRYLSIWEGKYFLLISKNNLVLAAHVVLLFSILEFLPSRVLHPFLLFLIKKRRKKYFATFNLFAWKEWVLKSSMLFALAVLTGYTLYPYLTKTVKALISLIAGYF